ncbi:MAG TPA: hypothetical protein VF017_23365 [Thermoanaerobaculia bacterium]|nr:hypothetical protein [Thermoanaerobaculia bacterium]
MSSEYEPAFSYHPTDPQAQAELAGVRKRFRAAAAPYLASPWPWLGWGLALPAAALGTRLAGERWGPSGVLLLWSFAILAAGAIEARSFWQQKGRGSLLAAWALRAQGNLSLVALLLSVALVVGDELLLLPGLWLLLLGHSFYILGGLSFRALSRFGLAYQLGGAAALFSGRAGLAVFAVTTAFANLGLALAVLRRGRLTLGAE